MWPLVFALLLSSPPAYRAVQPPVDQLAANIQKKYDAVRDFTVKFTQTYEGGVLRKRIEDHGTLQVKKPGKMRWTYDPPEKKLFVSDGTEIYSYLPDNNQVIVSPVPQKEQATMAVLFLTGKGDLTRDFSVSYADTPAGESTYALKLLPRHREQDYDWLLLVVDRTSLQIRTLVAVDAQGARSTYEFRNFKENTGLADKTFAFKIPPGVEVVRAGASR